MRSLIRILLCAALVVGAWLPPTSAMAQASPAEPANADTRFEAAFANDDPPAPGTATSAAPATAEPALPKAEKKQLSIFELVIAGGYIMIPIGAMSLLVGFYGFERWIALRRSRVIPYEFVQSLGQLTNRPGGLDPRLAYRLCQKYRCTAARVLRAALLKVGRPHSEVERAVADASEREAEDLYKNVRHLTMAMSLSPLLGLLGTVWGMVVTFFDVSQVSATVKAADLAAGIYVALVTTAAGLVVAIVAAILAHLFEGRIQSLFRQIDDLVQGLLPQLERYEGKLRVTTAEGLKAAAPPAELPVESAEPATAGATAGAASGAAMRRVKKV